MNNKGFTLIEFIVLVMIMLLLLLFSFSINRDKLSISLAGFIKPDDDQIFLAAKNYVLKEDISFDDKNYVCVSKRQLEITGYLKKIDNTNRTIKLTRNNKTKVIDKIEYVSECE